MTTTELENDIYKRLRKLGTYLCFEVGMPSLNTYQLSRERVDLLSYDTKGNWRFYELKVSVNDFKSKAKKSFYGNYNYYVMPKEIYEKVKHEIPKHIGVYTEYGCEKQSKRQELEKYSHNDLLFALMQGLYREYNKSINMAIKMYDYEVI